METTCTRCHQTTQAESCYCPHCGLPQLVYAGDNSGGQAPSEPWAGAVRDASTIDWKPAMRAALTLAVPAGLLSSAISPVGVLGLFWMAGAAAWAVLLYMRSQRPAWITIGAGARIGLVTGLLAAWLAFAVSGGTLFVQRFVLHQSTQIDADWKTRVNMSQEMAQEWTAGMGSSDAAHAEAVALRAQVQAWMMSPWGHAGIETFGIAVNSLFLLFFAAGGGAAGARMLARRRRPEV
ncbi:MAG: hypothetical protein KGM96_07735 [Acidobacteriota bacterium]|nr:hypothetical protein [Acidobacteriota bacterium]